MSRSGFLESSLAIAVAAVLCGVPATSSASSSEFPIRISGPSCPDVVVIGARGSGQNGKKERKDTKDLGQEVFKIASQLQKRLKDDDESMKMLGVPYSAVSVDVLRPNRVQVGLLVAGQVPAFTASYAAGNAATFTRSLEEGAQQLIDQTVTWATSCPDTDVVLSGYSQGAIAVHRALLRMKAENNVVASDAVLGAIVVADGDRVPTTTAKRFGSAKRDASGIRTYLRASDMTDFPDSETVVDICDKKDIVCDFNVTNVREFDKASKVHTKYPKRDGGKLLRRAANWFYEELLG